MSNSVDVIQRHIDAWNAHDAEADPWGADSEFHTPEGNVLHGRHQVLDFIRTLWRALPDARLEVVKRIADGDTVMSEGRLVGTHEGPLTTPDGEMPPSGRAVDIGWMCVQEVQGEELISEHLYLNQLDFLAQLGLVT